MHAGCERCSVHVPGCRTTVGVDDGPVGGAERRALRMGSPDPANPASDAGKWTGVEDEDRASGYECSC